MEVRIYLAKIITTMEEILNFLFQIQLKIK